MKHRTFPRITWIALVLYIGASFADRRVGLAAVACMAAPVMVSLFRGRLWCGRLCPRGSFLDLLPVRHPFKMPGVLKTVRFRVIFFALLMSAFAVQIFMSGGSARALGGVIFRMVLITTVISVILGLAFGRRTWCSICPMGTAASLLSKTSYSLNRAPKVVFNSDTCASCNLCGRTCPMRIHPLSFQKDGSVDHPDCIKCNQCVKACPSKKINAA